MKKSSTPFCENCQYYTEQILGAPAIKEPWKTGYCTCKYELARTVNGHKLAKPKPYRTVWRTWSCRSWIDRENGKTRFEALTNFAATEKG